MITILILFVLIAIFEWRSQAIEQHSKKNLVSVLLFIAAIMLTTETLYLLKDSFHLAVLIETLFSPLEHAIVGKSP
ncbi:hypothetical protein [Paenibacillus sp. HB172176]|uniref:hypothetical protein n=1 Tax=Paenibacillus sp. HB172176 TaxID=2493690 RepID=UPI0014396446|nr:hypothetical protein [Paenibacillus sp. HB172176]